MIDISNYFREISVKKCHLVLKFFFRLGRLHLNAGGLCPIRARAIMEYWQIDELLLGTKPRL